MKTNKILITTLVMLFSATAIAQPSERRTSKEDYITKWKDEAIRQMNTYGVPASITLSQGILESGHGNSELAKYANNHFGIKCHTWTGETMYKDDDTKNECFRSYFSASESFEDHSKFLAHRGRYESLFDLKITDYKGWAKGLRKAGYATNPKYADLLIKLIEENNLDQYDSGKPIPTQAPKPLTAERLLKTPKSVHSIKLHSNNIKYVVVGKGDTFWKIAKEFEMGLWQLYKYNDLDKKDILQVGDVIFLQPKRGKSKNKEHIIKMNETMRDISQKYGIKLAKLYKKNNLEYGSEPVVGSTLNLR